MRSKRLELMDQISAYIDQYYCGRQTTPSVNEVALGVGVSKPPLIATWWPWMNAECLNTTDPLEPS